MIHLIPTILNVFCQNLLFLFGIFKEIIINVFKNILFINKANIFNKVIGFYFIFIKKVYWIDLSLLEKIEITFMIVNFLFIIKRIISIITGNPLTIIITILSILIELIKLFDRT